MTTPIFCKECHKLAGYLVEDDQGRRLMVNGKSVINLGKGSSGNNIGIKCPDGHGVSVVL